MRPCTANSLAKCTVIRMQIIMTQSPSVVCATRLIVRGKRQEESRFRKRDKYDET